MATPHILVLTGLGINCEEETAYAFEYCGATADIIHVNDLIASKQRMREYQMLMFPGGFSYGDDTGSGKALANRIRNNLQEELARFIEGDRLVLGICNGFQVMANLGLVPAMDGFTGIPTVALEHNASSRYQCRWVDLKIEEKNQSIFLKGIDRLHIPVAHGEGNFYAPQDELERLEAEGHVAMRYIHPDGSRAAGEFPANPNGSLNDIAALSDATGRIMGMMPHPERGMFFHQRDDWTGLRELARRKNQSIPEETDGIAIFRNAVEWLSQ